MLLKAIAKAGLAAGLIGPPTAGGLWYGLAATEPQQESVRSIVSLLPSVLQAVLQFKIQIRNNSNNPYVIQI
jgi:hypothetical protein